MSDKKEDVLDRVNATLDRFALLIEESAQRADRYKAEWERQRAEDREEAKRQRAEDKAKDEKLQAEWKRQRAEDKAKDEKRQAEWERRDAKLSNKIANVSQQVGGQANRIGEITEAMTISDNIIDLVNKFERIDVQYFAFNITKKYPAKDSDGNAIRKQHEVDGLAEGEKSVVVIEAKTTLTKDYVEDFIEKLSRFKLAYHYHADKDIYGAVTFIRADDKALALAEEQGLFIIKASPPDVELTNNKGFTPTNFNWAPLPIYSSKSSHTPKDGKQ